MLYKNHGKLVNHNWFILVPFPRDRQEAIRDVKTCGTRWDLVKGAEELT
jgi:hypothetical protein